MKALKFLFLLLSAVLMAVVCILIWAPALDAGQVIKLPTPAYGEDGNGFTCTGLAYDKNEDVFYIGNVGKALPEEEGFNASIVKISKDFSHISGEINLQENFPEMKFIQGVAIDCSDDTIWLCSVEENKVRHIDKEGNDLGSINFVYPVGICYDSRNDSLWVISDEWLCNIKKDGEILKRFWIRLRGQDQIWLDENDNKIYLTAGRDYHKGGSVYAIDLSTGIADRKYFLRDSYAVEGIYIDGNRMYVLNDGYYHRAEIPFNQVNIYAIP